MHELRLKPPATPHREREGHTMYCFSQPKLTGTLQEDRGHILMRLEALGRKDRTLSEQPSYCFIAAMHMVEQTPQ